MLQHSGVPNLHDLQMEKIKSFGATSIEELRRIIKSARESENHELKRRNTLFLSSLRTSCIDPVEIIQESPLMQHVAGIARRIAQSNEPVLILGEKGTGKSKLAKYIFQMSDRKDRIFIEYNCSLTDEIQNAIGIFGRAATSANNFHRVYGVLETAHHATLLLKSVDALSYLLQLQLLDYIQTGSFINIEGKIPHMSFVRLHLTASVTPEQLEEGGVLHRQLWNRLRDNVIVLPRLVERKQDIPGLVGLFCRHRMQGKPVSRLNEEITALLESYSWPGNVRELFLVLDRALMLSQDEEIRLDVLQRVLGEHINRTKSMEDIHLEDIYKTAGTNLKNLKTEHIRSVLRNVGWDKKKAAEILGVTTRTLTEKIKGFQAQHPEDVPENRE
ncbi:MAG: sigma-54-dependent Fis family transcriptional regulator [Chlorobi bacterium]|nr:sigma-54-dependent Fis family transcriptional regulator [Chlorobiota bacterium]